MSADFAPYQRVPRVKPRRDIREGTIHRDPVYRRFLEQLEKGVEVRHAWCTLTPTTYKAPWRNVNAL